MTTQTEIILEAHMLKELHLLKCSSNTSRWYIVSPYPGNVIAFEDYPSFIWIVYSANAIKDSGFARTIRSDNTVYFTLIHCKAHVRQGRYSAEIDRKIINFKKIHNKPLSLLSLIKLPLFSECFLPVIRKGLIVEFYFQPATVKTKRFENKEDNDDASID